MTSDRLLLQVAYLYYRSGLTQQEVAARLDLGRVKVGRLLAEAATRGVVRVDIQHPLARLTELEYELQRAYALEQVYVTASPDVDDDLSRDAVARGAVDFLAGLRPKPTILGISWGRTMFSLANQVEPGWAEGVPVVQLNGAVSRSQTPTYADRIAERLAETSGAMAHLLAAPAIVDQPELRDALEADRGIAATLDIARAADVAVFSIGTIGTGSVLVESGYLDEDGVADLRARGCVGDVLSRFISADGAISDPDLDARTLGLPLADLARKRLSVGVATGQEKTAVTRAAIAGGYVNALVIDEHIAQDLLSSTPRQEATPHA